MTMTAARPDTISDYFRLDDELTADEISVRDKVRAFAEQRVLPVINEYWEKAEFPYELLPGLAELGIVGTTIQGYGCPGMSRKAAGMVAREMARADGSMNTFLGVHSNLCMGALNLLGSPEQKERWLPPLASIEKTGAFALTEPDHGSDSVALETRARREGDVWIIDGHKRWIGNGHAAEVVVLFARNVEDGKVNAFVVEKDGDGNHPAGYDPTVITGRSASARSCRPTSSSRTCASRRRTDWSSAAPSGTSPASCRPPAAAQRGRPSATPWPASRSPSTMPPSGCSSATRSPATNWSSPASPTCSAS